MHRYKIKIMLCGGLGNQLFQYAYARSLSFRLNRKLEVDSVSLFKYDKKYKRKFELNIFKLPDDVIIIKKNDNFEKVRRKYIKINDKFRNDSKKILYNQTTEKFENKYLFLEPENNICLIGYWQNINYFIDNKDLIKSELKFKNTASYNCEDSNKNSEVKVAVHVRCKDVDKVASKSFYDQALNIYVEKFGKINVSIFSDDVNEALKTLPNNDKISYSYARYTDMYMDFYNMTKFSNYILSGSTYCWWAYFLSEKTKKTAITPKGYCFGEKMIEL